MSKKETKKKEKSAKVDKSTKSKVNEKPLKKDNLNEELSIEKDKFLRLFAEFENYKRRTTKERIELFSTASQDVIKSLLPVLDDFDRALIELSKHEETDLTKGVVLIKDKLHS
ncbi:MAG: nucleotide exchange factor GrpE, partial [Flavobacteriaceae bacterium]